ncbi:hypothetical protein Q4485_01750 [Granulosicoccaceae sp. 1_MG-2023]|nr:hypothetical protein [Granulosicoccaceae sp. 1_MG-2023]
MNKDLYHGVARPVAVADLHAFILEEAEMIHQRFLDRLWLREPQLEQYWHRGAFPHVLSAVLEQIPDGDSRIGRHNREVALGYGCAQISPLLRPVVREELLNAIREVLCWEAHSLLMARCAAAFDSIFVLLDRHLKGVSPAR